MPGSKSKGWKCHINRKWLEKGFLWTILSTIPWLGIAMIHSLESRSIFGDHPRIAPFIRVVSEE
jgi:hypothetical protein